MAAAQKVHKAGIKRESDLMYCTRSPVAVRISPAAEWIDEDRLPDPIVIV